MAAFQKRTIFTPMLHPIKFCDFCKLFSAATMIFSVAVFAHDQQFKSTFNRDHPRVNPPKNYEVMAALYADYLRALPDYQIQLGFGTLEQANALMKKFNDYAERDSLFFQDKVLKLTFESPTYRVRLQYFADRIEAEKAYSQLRKLFPSAILLQPGSREIN